MDGTTIMLDSDNGLWSLFRRPFHVLDYFGSVVELNCWKGVLWGMFPPDYMKRQLICSRDIDIVLWSGFSSVCF